MTAPGHDESAQRASAGLLLLLGSLTMLAPASIDMYLPAMPTLGAELDAGAGQTQATMAAFLVGMAFGQFIYGPASDRLGRRPMILTGLGIYVVASAACAITPSMQVFIGARFIQGLGVCAGSVGVVATLRDRFAHGETARALSQMLMITMVAPIVAPLLGGALLSLAGWRSNFWVMAAFGSIIALSSVLWLNESRSAETAAVARGENPLAAYLTLVRQRRLVGYMLAGGLNGATLFTYIAASPELLIEIYGVSPNQFGWVFSVNAIGVVIASQANRLLLRRLAPEEVLRYSSTVAFAAGGALTVAAFSGVGGAWSVLPLLFAVMASYGFLQGNTTASALNLDPRRSGSVSALMGGMSFGAGALASSLVALLADGTARPMALVMLLALGGSMLMLRFVALPAFPVLKGPP